MNTLSKLLALGAIAIGPGMLMAQNVEQIHMKSGSVVEGYIAEQKPGKHITIQTTKATIVVNSDSLQNRVIEKFPLIRYLMSGENGLRKIINMRIIME